MVETHSIEWNTDTTAEEILSPSRVDGGEETVLRAALGKPKMIELRGQSEEDCRCKSKI